MCSAVNADHGVRHQCAKRLMVAEEEEEEEREEEGEEDAQVRYSDLATPEGSQHIFIAHWVVFD